MSATVTAPRRRALAKTAALLLVATAVSLLLLELGLRALVPKLRPDDPRSATELGLPRAGLDEKFREVARTAPALVVIGDSYVETGDEPEGWVSCLRQASGRKIVAFGFQGACPSQYFWILDELRRRGTLAPVLVTLYLGNDFTDEGVWAGMGKPDHADYLNVRRAHYDDPRSPFFFPCMTPAEAQERGLRALGEEVRRSATYRAATLAKDQLKAKLSSKAADPLEMSPAQREALLIEVMDGRCQRPPWTETIDGRLFFIRHHEALMRQPDPVNDEGRRRTIALLKDHQRDPSLAVAVILDREENCRAVHGRPVTAAGPFIGEVRGLGLTVFDPNPELQTGCREENIYLPDGHLNQAGHRVLGLSALAYLGERRW